MRSGGDPLARMLVSGTALNAVGAFLGKPMDLAAVAIIVHRIGAPAYGVIVIAQGLSLWPSLLEKGVGQTLARLMAGDRTSRHASLFTTGVLFYVLLGAATLLVG